MRENLGGPQKKVNIGAQLQTYNNAIIVLKITPLHSVFVITNFVIPKRNKKTDKHTT